MDVIGICIEDLPKKEKHAVGVREKFLGCKLRPVSLYYNGETSPRPGPNRVQWWEKLGMAIPRFEFLKSQANAWPKKKKKGRDFACNEMNRKSVMQQKVSEFHAHNGW